MEVLYVCIFNIGFTSSYIQEYIVLQDFVIKN